MRVLAIIPAYNEEDSIGTVVNRVKLFYPQADVLVINDGSRDRTCQMAFDAGAMVISLPFNLGIGGAMQTGFIFAKRKDYDIAVQVDADGQHDPIYMKELIEPIEKGEAHMVIGSRYIKKTSYKSPLVRRVGMILFSLMIGLITGQKVMDTTSGYRAVNKEVINFFAEKYPADYPEVDVLVRLKKRKYKIIELSVEMSKRHMGKSSITALKSVYYMLKVGLSIIIGSVRTNE